MAKRSIQDLVSDKYQDESLHGPILEDIERLKTGDRILSGELVLPSEQDARIWLDRKEGRISQTPTEREQQSKIDALEKRLNELLDKLGDKEAKQPEENPPQPEVIVQGGGN